MELEVDVLGVARKLVKGALHLCRSNFLINNSSPYRLLKYQTLFGSQGILGVNILISTKIYIR
jgi:hypothetical protein